MLPRLHRKIVRPDLSVSIQSAVGYAHAGCSAVPGEDDVATAINGIEIRQLAIVSLYEAAIIELELLYDIGHPTLAEAFPGEHVDAACAQQIPQGHFNGSRVGCGHNADDMVIGHQQHLAGQVDNLL